MITVPFLDLNKVNAELNADIRAAWNDVLKSGWYILGNQVSRFEKTMTTYLFGEDIGYVVSCNSGTDAITLSLLDANVGFGDEVITVSHTAIPTVTAIVSTGATPVFVDVDEKTWVMDISAVSAQFSAKTKAIIPVHLYGNMVDVLTLKEVLADYGRDDIIIIEDAAQSQGSCMRGFQAGTIGNFGAFSFYPSKNIGALGDGGAIACKTESDYRRLCSLRNYGQEDRYNAVLPRGMNSRLDELQASILQVKLAHLSDWLLHKKEMMKKYREELHGYPVDFQQVTPDCEPGWHLCVIACENRCVRDELQKFLYLRGIETFIHYPIPAHQQVAFATDISLSITEGLAGRILSLPLNIALTADEQMLVCNTIKDFFNEITGKIL